MLSDDLPCTCYFLNLIEITFPYAMKEKKRFIQYLYSGVWLLPYLSTHGRKSINYYLNSAVKFSNTQL